MPIRRCSGSTHEPLPATSRPPIATRPASGRSKPATTRSSVVLPEPLGPSSATSSPCADAQARAVDRTGGAERLLDALRVDRQIGLRHHWIRLP